MKKTDKWIFISDESRSRSDGFDLEFIHRFRWLRSALSGRDNYVGLDGYDNLSYNDPDYNDHYVMPACII